MSQPTAWPWLCLRTIKPHRQCHRRRPLLPITTRPMRNNSSTSSISNPDPSNQDNAPERSLPTEEDLDQELRALDDEYLARNMHHLLHLHNTITRSNQAIHTGISPSAREIALLASDHIPAYTVHKYVSTDDFLGRASARLDASVTTIRQNIEDLQRIEYPGAETRTPATFGREMREMSREEKEAKLVDLQRQTATRKVRIQLAAEKVEGALAEMREVVRAADGGKVRRVRGERIRRWGGQDDDDGVKAAERGPSRSRRRRTEDRDGERRKTKETEAKETNGHMKESQDPPSTSSRSSLSDRQRELESRFRP